MGEYAPPPPHPGLPILNFVCAYESTINSWSIGEGVIFSPYIDPFRIANEKSVTLR